MRSADIHAPGMRTMVSLRALTTLIAVAVVALRYLGLESLARLALVGLAGAGLAVAFFVRPIYGVYFMVLYVYSGLNFYFGGSLVAPAVMAVVLAGVLVELLRGDLWRLNDQVFLWSVFLFALVALQSFLWAQSVKESVLGYSRFLKSFSLLFLIVQLIRTPRDLLWFARLIFVGAVATIALGLINWKFGFDRDISRAGGGYFMRFTGAHQDPNLAASLMTAAIPMGVFAIREARSHAKRILSALGVVVLIIGAFATLSRSALFGFTFVALAVLFRSTKSRKVYFAFFLLLAVGVVFTPRYYWVRIWSLADISETMRGDWSLFLRATALQHSWELFKDHPLFGVGLRNFIVRGGDVVFVRMVVHNSYFEILCGLGIIGLSAYFAVLYSGFRQLVRGIRARWRKQHQWIGDLSFYLLVSFIATLISAFFLSMEFNYIIWIPLAGSFVIANLIDQVAEQQ